MGQKNTKYFYPPRPGNGAGTFSDDIVGLQTVQGGGLTLGNFEFTTSVTEKVNRKFNIGAFSEPISLDDMDINSLTESRRIIESQFKVYPNYDVSQVLNFTMYGSLAKRFSVSVTKIINYFPAGLEVLFTQTNLTTGATAYDVSYDVNSNETYFKVNVNRIHNPFSIDFSENSDSNILFREVEVSSLRNLNKTYLDYVLNINGENYSVVGFTPSQSLDSGFLEIYVVGDPFNTASPIVYESFIVRPNDLVSDKVFQENLDEVEKFLMNRLVVPEYTAYFQVPQQNEFGQFYVEYKQVTWPKDGIWNLDLKTI